MPRTVKEIEQAVEQLTPDQLAEFRAWYEQFDAAAWDRQIGIFHASGKDPKKGIGSYDRHQPPLGSVKARQ